MRRIFMTSASRLVVFGLVFAVMEQSQASVTTNHFSKLEEGDFVVGALFENIVTMSSLHCSMRCTMDIVCFAYEYSEQEDINCRIIHRNSLAGQKFVSNGTRIYLKACTDSWIPPNNWTIGDQPSVYRSFQREDYCLELINGASIVLGEVSYSVKTNSSFKQWVSLGELSRYTCLPNASTCGPEGASLSVWIRIENGSGKSGVISSFAHSSSIGFGVRCYPGNTKIRYTVRIPDGYFHYNHNPVPTDWYHFALVYHGPNNGQGISIYHDGILLKHDMSKSPKNHTDSSGTVIIGKRYTDRDEDYGSVVVDELTFWDRQLLPEEIQAIVAM